jgi:Flp pilus assembly protein TadD
MSERDAYEFKKQGIRLFEQGNYHAAIGCFEQAVALARRDGKTGTELDVL